MQIEMLEPEWSSPVIQEYVELLRSDVAKAMALPEWAMRSPEAHAQAQDRAYKATEVMRREIARLMIEHCRPRCILRPADA